MMDEQPDPNRNYTDAMLDNETLATTPTALLMCAGIGLFNRYDPAVPVIYKEWWFYPTLYMRTHSDPGTCSWWNKQARTMFPGFHNDFLNYDKLEAIMELAWRASASPVTDTEVNLLQIARLFQDYPNVDRLWSNGASFDIPQLQYYMSSYGIKDMDGIFHKGAACLRTIRRESGVNTIPWSYEGQRHTSKADVLYQIDLLRTCDGAMRAKQAW